MINYLTEKMEEYNNIKDKPNILYSIIYDNYNNCELHVKSRWKQNEITLLLFNFKNAWKVDICQFLLAKEAKNFNMQCDTYVDQLKKIISQKLDYITFELRNNFVIYDNKELPIKYLTAPAIAQDIGVVVKEIWAELINENNKLLNATKSLADKLTATESEKNKLLKKIHDSEANTESSEKELLSKFVLVLNEKKDHIQYLTERLECCNCGKLRSNVNSKGDQNKLDTDEDDERQTTSKTLEVMSESDATDSDGYETEENDLETTDDVQEVQPSMVQPSTSSTIFELFKRKSRSVSLVPKRFKNDKDPAMSNESKEVPATVLEVEKKHEGPVVISNKSGNITSNESKEKKNEYTEEDSPQLNYNTQDLIDDM